MTDGVAGRDDYYKALNIMDKLWAKRDRMEQEIETAKRNAEAQRQAHVHRLADEREVATRRAAVARQREQEQAAKTAAAERESEVAKEALAEQRRKDKEKRDALDDKNESRKRGKREREVGFEDALKNKVVRVQRDIGMVPARRINTESEYSRLYKRNEKTKSSKKATEAHYVIEAVCHCFTPTSRQLGGGWKHDRDIELQGWVTPAMKDKMIQRLFNTVCSMAEAKGLEKPPPRFAGPPSPAVQDI